MSKNADKVMRMKCAAIVFIEGAAAAPNSGCTNSTGIEAEIASVKSVVPIGTTIPYTSLATGSPTTAGGYKNGTMTTTSATKTPTSSASAAATSKSGAVNGTKYHSSPKIWIILVTVLGKWII